MKLSSSSSIQHPSPDSQNPNPVPQGPNTDIRDLIRRSRLLAALLIGLVFGPSINSLQAAEMPTVGLDQDVLVVCLRFSFVTETRMESCQDWVDLFNNQVNTFYDQNSRGRLSFRFSTPSSVPDNGWIEIPWDPMDFFGINDAVGLGMPEIDSYVDFATEGYNRLVFVNAGSGFFGQARPGYSWIAVDEGEERMLDFGDGQRGYRWMTAAVVSEWIAGSPMDGSAAILSHELGHSLNVPVHYGGVVYDGRPFGLVTPWSVMGLNYNPPAWPPHYFAFSKQRNGWLDLPDIETLGPPMGQAIDRTIRLRPHSETPGLPGKQLIALPFLSPGGPTQGYMVEARRRDANVDGVMESGVIVTLVDQNPGTVVRAWVEHDPDHPTDRNRAALEPGDMFEDVARGLTIEVLSAQSDGWDVRIRWQVPQNQRPDPRITPWAAPPWETPDIWVDSEKNGWDTYQFTDAAGDPVGNGDEPWLDRDNRIYFRVHNGGNGPATQLRADVFAAVVGIGDSEVRWNLVGTNLFSLINQGDSAIGWVNWKPKENEHTCLKVRIQAFPEDLNLANNQAQENIFVFETERNSPWHPRTEMIRVVNPSTKEPAEVSMQVTDIPAQWSMRVVPRDFTLAPGGEKQVEVTVYAGGPPGGPESQGYDAGYVGKPKVHAMMPFEDSFISLGGVEPWTHLTLPTELDMKAVVDSNALVVSGCLDQSAADRIIAIEIVEVADGDRQVLFANTDSQGCYYASTEGFDSGKHLVQAFHEGSGPWGSSQAKQTLVYMP